MDYKIDQCPDCGKYLYEDAVHTCSPQANAQPAHEQEPVAWMTRFDDPERGSYGKPADTHLKKDEAERQVQRHIAKRLCKLRVEPLYTTTPVAQPAQEPVKLRRGDILRCIETDELCTVWATSATHKTLVKWGGNDFTEYTAEQIGELFWLEPESSDVEIAAEQSDNYAAFHAGVRFARAHTPPAAPVREWVGLTDDEVEYPYPPAKPPVYATAKNTKSVRNGYEMSGYEKEPGYYSEEQLDEFAKAIETKLKEKNT